MCSNLTCLFPEHKATDSLKNPKTSLHPQELLLPLRKQRKKRHVPVFLLTWLEKPQKWPWRDFRGRFIGLWEAAQSTARNMVKVQDARQRPAQPSGVKLLGRQGGKGAPRPVLPILLGFLLPYLCGDLSGWCLAFFVAILSLLHNTSQGINKRIKLLGQLSWSRGSDMPSYHPLSFHRVPWLKGSWK